MTNVTFTSWITSEFFYVALPFGKAEYMLHGDIENWTRELTVTSPPAHINNKKDKRARFHSQTQHPLARVYAYMPRLRPCQVHEQPREPTMLFEVFGFLGPTAFTTRFKNDVKEGIQIYEQINLQKYDFSSQCLYRANEFWTSTSDTMIPLKKNDQFYSFALLAENFAVKFPNPVQNFLTADLDSLNCEGVAQHQSAKRKINTQSAKVFADLCPVVNEDE